MFSSFSLRYIFSSVRSPGSAFFLPHGTRVYNRLVNLMKSEYEQRGYTEVITPNVYNVDLWKTSGHYQNYKDNMFTFECEKQEFAMKPMVSRMDGIRMRMRMMMV